MRRLVFGLSLLVGCVESGRPECKGWAETGECRENPKFMLYECKDECIGMIPWGPSSHATKKECEKWAEEDYQCSENIAFMNLHCADQCGHQWRWVPEVRRVLGLAMLHTEAQPLVTTVIPKGPEILDFLYAAEWQCLKLESIIHKGENLNELADNSRGVVRGFGGILLYAARMLGNSGLASTAKAALQDDANRRDWILRKAPDFVTMLRRAVDAAQSERETNEKDRSYERLGVYERLTKRRVRNLETFSLSENPKTTAYLQRAQRHMPLLGIGTCWLNENESEAAVRAVLHYLAAHPDHPGVHIDSAEAYRNEAAIGRALASSPVTEKRIFLASKLSDERWLSYDGARLRLNDALKQFGTEHIDLFSLHSSFGFKHSASRREQLREAWRGLVSCVREGKVSALGLSNFNEAELRDFALDPFLGGLFMPDVLQNKFDIYRRGEQLSFKGDGDPLLALRDLNMTLVAYSTLSGWPFGFGALSDPFVHQLAAFFKVTPATLLLRWTLANGHAIIPRSKSPEHVDTNLNILNDLPILPHTAKDLLDGLAFLTAHDDGNDPSDAFGAFDSFSLFSSSPGRRGEVVDLIPDL